MCSRSRTALKTNTITPTHSNLIWSGLQRHVQVVVASPNGTAAPLDPSPVEAFKGGASATKFLNTKEALWKNTHKLSNFLGHANEYKAIFFVGGHGPMFGLARDPTSHKLINEFWAHNTSSSPQASP
ncbi:hypothetical protein BDZ45DRAFT_693808 [Acephala macrosclerotiorum]|nr:hypothetical protein BDZ45DRAFT_693808 [Acephala macrosclerotiorum]